MSTQQRFKAISKVPAYQLVEEAIRGMIMGGELAKGDLLPPEVELAQEFGVTGLTVREAFRSLEGAGLLERGLRRRMVVSAPSIRIVHKARREAIVLHGVTYQELWEVSMALEPAAAALAASRISPELLNQLKANLERTAECLDNSDELVKCDLEFHELVAQAPNNHALLLAREPLGDLTLPASLSAKPGIDLGKRLLEAHTKIYKALKNGNEKLARDWMFRHIRAGRQACEVAGIELDSPVNIRR